MECLSDNAMHRIKENIIAIKRHALFGSNVSFKHNYGASTP